MLPIWKIVWKTSAVAVGLLAGAFGASQAGWSGAELFVNLSLMGTFEEFVTSTLCNVGLIIAVTATILIYRIAKPALWIMMPIILYSAVVLGAWNGVASDFDATRGEAIKYHSANAYALEHMSERGRFLSCDDERIDLTDDAKALCTRTLNVSPGERIPGSEHNCGPLGLFTCFNTAPEKQKSDH